MKQESKNNALVSVKEHTSKSGKVYHNIYVEVKLTNGKVVNFEATQKFYNSKFNWLIINNLPRKD